MKKLESSLVNMVGVLVVVALIMGGILAFVNHLTKDTIDQQKEKKISDGIKLVMGGNEIVETDKKTIDGQDFDKDGKSEQYVVHMISDPSGKELGAAVESSTQGFGGDLKILVGFNPDGDILGYTVSETQETPGLGAKADQWFQKGGKGDIIGKNPDKNTLLVTKDEDKASKKKGEVDAITASTITSRAFLKAVNNAYAAYRNKGADASSSATQQQPSTHGKEKQL